MKRSSLSSVGCPTATVRPAPAPWVSPRIEELPRLTELTLQTGSGIPGECGIGGSTCF